MSEQRRKTVYLKGLIYWVKILDAPKPNFDGDAREWTFEFEPDEDSKAVLEENGLLGRLKDGKKKDGTIRKNYEGRKPFLILRRGEFKTTGEANEKIRVVDAANQDWNKHVKIGNGTLADVKVQIVDWGPRKKEGIYPLAVRVLELIPYVPNEFEPLPDDDPHVQAVRAKDAEFRKDFGLDDPEEPEPELEAEAPESPSYPDEQADELDDEAPV